MTAAWSRGRKCYVIMATPADMQANGTWMDPANPNGGPQRKFGFADNRFMFNRGHWKKFELTSEGPRVAAVDKKGRPGYGLNGADEESFATDWLCDRLLDFIDEHADEPFCYHLSLPDPHGPNTVRPPYDTAFVNTPVRPPMTFARTDANPKWAPINNKNGVKKFNAALMQAYFGMVACIDDNRRSHPAAAVGP